MQAVEGHGHSGVDGLNLLHRPSFEGALDCEFVESRVQVRRVSLDLLGLPPTPEEVDTFVYDERPDAYERLIERLLASPHYGERWARVWLDKARYSDKTASWLNNTGEAHLYRDWVVKAFNEDKPYDRFIKEQIAGDLLPIKGDEDWQEFAATHIASRVIKGEARFFESDDFDQATAWAAA